MYQVRPIAGSDVLRCDDVDYQLSEGSLQHGIRDLAYLIPVSAVYSLSYSSITTYPQLNKRAFRHFVSTVPN